MKKAATPLVNKTKTDFKIHIAKPYFAPCSAIEYITGRFEKPGFTPSGRGIRLSAADIPADKARRSPHSAVFLLFIVIPPL